MENLEQQLGSRLLMTPEYRDMLLRMYRKMDWGGSGHKRAQFVRDFCAKLGTRDLLDYGCGQGKLKTELGAAYNMREYDPGIASKSGLPDPADIVTCTDVLEHIEPECLDNVLAHLRQLSRRGMFLLVATRPANKCLLDGRNSHLIIEHMDWWIERIRPVLDMGHWKIDNQSNKQFLVWTWAK